MHYGEHMLAKPHENHGFHKHQQQHINAFFGQNFTKN